MSSPLTVGDTIYQRTKAYIGADGLEYVSLYLGGWTTHQHGDNEWGKPRQWRELRKGPEIVVSATVVAVTETGYQCKFNPLQINS